MKRISIPYIENLCFKLERLTNNSFKKKNFSSSLRLLKVLSFIRYKFHLGYKNEFIENNIIKIANHIEKIQFADNGYEKSIVIIDEINADYVGLMTQYLNPFIQDSYQILYLYEHKEHPEAVRSQLMQTLNSYDKVILKEIPSDNNRLFRISQWIYNEVCTFGSRKVLMNFGEWAVEKCVACYALPGECVKYHINAGDHCFWAGACCADYSFELRHYGANLSHKYRGLSKEQIVYLPFYPVMKEIPFEGFPKDSEGKFIFLSGGAVYKIIDEEKTFFRLCKKILRECPNAIILFAGDNTGNIVLNGIEEFEMQNNFYYLGYRNDIYEVFKHSDVFIDTYPIGGGTMCQFAAQCSKPIVNYLYPGVEECVAQKGACNFTFYKEEDFVKEAVRLYNDTEYRKSRGKMVNDAVVSKDEFDHALLSFMSTKKRIFEVEWDDNFAPRTLSTEDAVNYNNQSLFVFYYLLFRILGWDSIWIMPENVVSCGVDWVVRKIKKLIKLR